MFFCLQKPQVTFKTLTHMGVSVGVSHGTGKRRRGVWRKLGQQDTGDMRVGRRLLGWKGPRGWEERGESARNTIVGCVVM